MARLPEGDTLETHFVLGAHCAIGSSPDGTELRVWQFLRRPDDPTAACADGDLGNADPVPPGHAGVDGLYCARLERSGAVIGSVAFLVYAGTPPSPTADGDDDEAAREAAARVANEALLITEDERRVRVRYAEPALVDTLVAYETRRVRAAQRGPEPFDVVAHGSLVRFQFCCGEGSPYKGPVAQANEAGLDWLTETIPRKARGRPLRLVGYASTPGACEANTWLSAWRARAVRHALRARGFRNLDLLWCGETGPEEPAIAIDRAAHWQRVDVILPADHVTFRVARRDAKQRITPMDPGTSVHVIDVETGRIRCEARSDHRNRQVDLVLTIDTSGSMADDWSRWIIPELTRRTEELVAAFAADGIDATVTVYTLDANLCGVLGEHPNLRCAALPATQLAPCNRSEPNESWGTAISWAARHHPWRPRAIRAVLPMSDELACEGSHTGSHAEDVAAAELAAADAQRFGVLVFPYFGTLTAAYQVDYAVRSLMEEVARRTGGAATALSSLSDAPFERVYAATSRSVHSAAHGMSLSCSGLGPDSRVRVEVRDGEGATTWTREGTLASWGVGDPQEDWTRGCKRRRACTPDDDAPVFSQPPPPRKGPVLDCSQGRG